MKQSIMIFVITIILSWKVYSIFGFYYYLQNFKEDYEDEYQQIINHMEKKISEIPNELINNIPNELDIVLPGCGFKNGFSYGVLLTLDHIHNKYNKGKIKRYSGTSSGTTMCLTMYYKEFKRTLFWSYSVCKTLKKYRFLKLLPMWSHYHNLIVNDNFLPNDDKFYISMTNIIPFKNLLISTYKNKKDFVDAIIGSTGLPFLMGKHIFGNFRNKYVLDGCLTNNTPFFEDNLRKQLVVENLKNKYGNKMIYFSENEITQLVKDGIDDFVNYIINNKSDFIKIF
tara:strand:- start:1547 stop:2395 length:849 start_codon:yes stop_codon:yes gene_type:complete